QDGKDGKIGMKGKDGRSADITIGQGKDGVDGKNGENGITRIIYKDEKGETRQVATLDDGLKFKGDNDTVVTRKLNEKLDIKGGITDENLATTGNIGVFGTQDGGMTVKLAKKLTGLTSAEFKEGDNVTNITAGDVSVTRKEGNKNKTVNLWGLSNTVNNLKGGFTLKDAAGTTTEVTLGDTNKPAITFKAATEDTDGAASALTAKVDNQKNVTYTLNTKKLKEEMGLTQGVGSMSSWNLKATGDTKSEAIANGNTVEFEVETADKGLTVKRVDKKIQYGINVDKLVENINTATTKITNVDVSDKVTKVTVDGQENKETGNLKIKKTDKDGQLTYDLSLNDEITIGKAGQDGKDGKIGMKGKDGRSA
ncbi:MAG: hypothetical protein ACLTM5_06445, partial [Dialister sp.]